jgi:hypothetical protein
VSILTATLASQVLRTPQNRGNSKRLLGQFLDYLDANGADRITVEHALAWATLPGRGQHWHAMRLGAVRGFARRTCYPTSLAVPSPTSTPMRKSGH